MLIFILIFVLYARGGKLNGNSVKIFVKNQERIAKGKFQRQHNITAITSKSNYYLHVLSRFRARNSDEI